MLIWDVINCTCLYMSHRTNSYELVTSRSGCFFSPQCCSTPSISSRTGSGLANCFSMYASETNFPYHAICVTSRAFDLNLFQAVFHLQYDSPFVCVRLCHCNYIVCRNGRANIHLILKVKRNPASEINEQECYKRM